MWNDQHNLMTLEVLQDRSEYFFLESILVNFCPYLLFLWSIVQTLDLKIKKKIDYHKVTGQIYYYYYYFYKFLVYRKEVNSIQRHSIWMPSSQLNILIHRR